MAVEGDGALYPTEAIISTRARKHYRVPVRSPHWQLRSLISAEKQHIVYFPGGHGGYYVQRLNVITRECETIKLLTFAPRCLVAENGWLCCGSENGDLVAIRLDEGEGGDTRDTRGPRDNRDERGEQSHQAENRSQNPPSNDPEPESRSSPGAGALPSSEDWLLSLIAQARRTSNKTLVAKSMRLAKERVNCITLWFPPTDNSAVDNAYREPVAVLANNDKTVTLVSLNDFDANETVEPLDVVLYPDFVNRAIISPDGRIMIAILDDPYLYVHQRVQVSPSALQGGSPTQPPKFQWELKRTLLLKSQRKDEKADSRGSFAACFSSSGVHLAVGTQHGTISIFNTALLTHDTRNPLITTFTSSRPTSGPGAVRDMAFCPGPYDLFAWTEDRGHIGIADMRSNFMVRQIIDINVEAGFEHINVLDCSTIDPRLLESRAHRRDNGSSTGPLATNSSSLDLVNYPLTVQELRVLEALQGNRIRRDQLREQANDEASRRTPETLPWPYQSPTNESNSPRPNNDRSTSVTRTMGDIIGAYRDQRERAQERVRNARQIMREGNNDRQAGNARRVEDRWVRRLNESVAALGFAPPEMQDSAYLSVLELLRARDASNNTETDVDESSLLVPLVNQVVNRWEESAIRGTLTPDHGAFEVPPSPDNTAGLAWSQDGRTLFIGAHNGIYEFHVDTHSRKFSPSIRMR